MAVAKDASMARKVNTPIKAPTDCGWEKLFPFTMAAWKQPISVWVELANICKRAYPSRSGIPRAMDGMPETIFGETGITANAVIGLLAFKGHMLAMFALQGS